MSSLKFYFDEPVELAVCEQLIRAGVDAVSVHGLGFLGESDAFHLQKAKEMGRILCTYDADFLALASEGAQHAGILFAPQQSMSIGQWVRNIQTLSAQYTAEQFESMVMFLPLKS